ncbi:hypothetical protein MLD38_036032 [Melastoma candidum]|uniref:Uncharacterized protein n=1 Tax=Melastoma candidum TaxID=119954 RepID=A0ACB9LJC4_9MYRT|nr:hypothetical protein MLD38_036032 [Melastoma candidum]
MELTLSTSRFTMTLSLLVSSIKVVVPTWCLFLLTSVIELSFMCLNKLGPGRRTSSLCLIPPPAVTANFLICCSWTGYGSPVDLARSSRGMSLDLLCLRYKQPLLRSKLNPSSDTNAVESKQPGGGRRVLDELESTIFNRTPHHGRSIL